MDLGFFGFALAAGALATVNPCGFVMLPALVAIQLRQTGDPQVADRRVLVARGLAFGVEATLGFLIVFGVLGLVVSLGARFVTQLFPIGGLIVGIVLLVAGLSGWFGRRPLPIPGSNRRPFGARVPGGLAFGAAYATASLSCTLPIFLAVIGGTLAVEGLAAVLVPLVGYALGMGAILLAVTLATALSAGAVVRGLRRAMPYVETIGSGLLAAVGGYLVIYWLPRLFGAS